MRAVIAIVVAAGCSGPSSSTGDLDAAGSGSGSGSDDAFVDPFVDPEWPEHVAIQPEIDFPPYLNLLDPTTVVVSWRTVAASTGTVKYGTTASYGSEAASTTSANLHHVTLSNLQPGTGYYYEVAITGTTVVRKGVFVTPGRTDWRFMHSGEYHAPSESINVAKFAEEIRAFRPHVIIESGDMVDDGNDITHWRSYFRTSAPWLANTLLLPSHSNHVNGSDGNNSLLDYFVLPQNERWYPTRYSQVQFLNIDSTYNSNSDVMTDEVPWVRQQAMAAHDGTDDPTFLIASWHHPACSSQYSSRLGERVWVQSNLVDAFKDNGGVDLIVAAHDKYYERSTITGGIIHIITNIGNISPSSPGSNHPDCTAELTIRDTLSTAFFTVAGTTLTAKIIDETGAELDTFTITK